MSEVVRLEERAGDWDESGEWYEEPEIDWDDPDAIGPDEAGVGVIPKLEIEVLEASARGAYFVRYRPTAGREITSHSHRLSDALETVLSPLGGVSREELVLIGRLLEGVFREVRREARRDAAQRVGG